MPPVSTGFAQASACESSNILQHSPETHNGHSEGVHKLLGSAAILSNTRFLEDANSEAAVPRTTKAPTATGVAPQATKAANVPRTAEPAFTTSLTIATRLFRTLL